MSSFSKNLIIIGATGLLLSGCSSAAKTGSTSEQPTAAQGQVEQKPSEPTTLLKMAAAKQAGTCIITDATNATPVKIEVTMKDKKMLMKSQLTADSATSYIMTDGEFSYMWDSKTKSGAKLKAPAETDAAASDAKKTEMFSRMEDTSKYKVDCKTSSVDDQVFTPPADVTFKSMDKT